MEEFAVFKSMEKDLDLEEKHPHKVVAIHKGKVISKKLEIVSVDLHPKLDIDCLVGRNLFGEIDVHLLRKSGRVVMDLEVVEV
ncbi:MAG: hypothetical protein CHKLHMKO_00379 [Candidatus Argoarchaeum ethanivorans]|uniref:Uncharacterized protein n=1 Tax=Candidatus Argoarchaeum ethanivorans TaxID=2608793 RepID=A0A811T6S2_9EURY|nr:MAG: hypothetical protein CHKLHMKO_00379 [Candidatus Argoarchaeum ethanivorans]